MSLYDSEGTGTDAAADPEELLRKKLAQMPPAPMPQQTTSIDALARNPQNLLMPAAPMPRDPAATQMPPAGIPGAQAATNPQNTLTMPAATTPQMPRDDSPAGSGESSVPRTAQMPAATLPADVKAATGAGRVYPGDTDFDKDWPYSARPTGHYEGDVWHPDLKQRSDAAATPPSAVSSDLVSRAMQSASGLRALQTGSGRAREAWQSANPAQAASGGANPARNYAQDYEALLNQEPNRSDFPASKMPFWKKALGLAAAGAAGFGRNDDTTYGLARKILNGPRAAADDQFNDAHERWEGRLKGIDNEAKIAHLQPPQSPEEHAKLADLYADAVKKSVAAGRNPLEDPDVKKYGDAIQNLQPERAQRTQADNSESTPFKLWRQQHPNADVKEYFKLQPEARNETRPPKDTARLTPGQKASITSRYKQSLSDIEDEFQSRQSGSYVDKRSGELLPPMPQTELNHKKQQAENSYKDELEAAGEPNVTRFNYSTGRNDSEGSQPQGIANSSATAPAATKQSGGTQHRVGDIVTYQGKQHRITAIRNGKADLVPVPAGQ
jgi:hypothetical protein